MMEELKRWDVIANLFDVDKELRGIEVGVWYGRCSKRLLRAMPKLTLFSVDSWEPNVDQSTMDGFSREMALGWWRKNADGVYLAATRRLKVMGDRSKIIRADAGEAANRFDDESMDFVFLDGDHRRGPTYDHCKAYWPKVKPGGWLVGHDYGYPCEHWGVAEAVNDFAAEQGVAVVLDDDLTWRMQKPEKDQKRQAEKRQRAAEQDGE